MVRSCMFEYTSRVSYTELGPDGRMSIPALLARLQDCCAFHSEEIGRGPLVWQKERCGFIIVFWQVVLHRIPDFGENITTRTWPYGFRGFYGDRNFTVNAPDGSVLAEVNSSWVYFDRTTQRPMKVPEKEIKAFGVEEPLRTFEYATRRIGLPETEPERFEPFAVSEAQIDMNEHMNNIEYVRAAFRYAHLPADSSVSEMRIQYIRQSRLGDVLTPVRYADGKNIYISLNTSSGSPCAIVFFMLS